MGSGISKHSITYPVSLTLGVSYGFGFLAGFFLGLQIFSGLLLACFFVPEIDLAFDSLLLVEVDIVGGWLVR